ncbi:PspC domain-containing protein [Demequina zhanjiangensis]|uniref:PspC domain-containing protein n=1 Tax=Demequina zhanjiangensis TaxID=3051659 RepID=A0ABT8FXP5_9MICO|nr:PspC domain-containing protein [Demequina sp. SYSU T00b26]MDN4471587.1 PspC domain-containing protein [Demequina sp. SYSU T00b26]
MTQPQEQPAHEAAFFATIRSWGLMRGDNGLVGGVIEGVGERIGLARVPARLLFLLIAIFTSGLAALAYAAGWGLLPDRRGNIIIQNFGRGVTNVGALLGIALLTLIGLGGFSDGVSTLAPWNWAGGWPWEQGWGFRNTIALVWWFVVAGGIAWLVIHLIQKNRADGSGQAVPPAPGAPTPPVGSTTTTPAAPPVYAALPGEAGPGAPGWNAAAATPPASQTMPQAQPQADAHDPAAQASAQAQAAAQQQAWQAQQQAQQRAWEAEQRARAAAANRPPRVPGPGAAGYLTALAWFILSGVGVWVAARNDVLAVHPLVAWPVAVLIGWGAILIVVSLLGRRLGFLGFLTVASILPALIIGAGADDLRDAWHETGAALPAGPDGDEVAQSVEDWIRENIDPEFTFEDGSGSDVVESDGIAEADDNTVTDPASFFADYATVQLRGSCYTDEAADWPTADETLAFSAIPSDQRIVVTAETTSLTVPAGTHLTVEADGDAWATVAWLDRGLACDFLAGDTTYVDLVADPDAPTVTLVVEDDAYANTILIRETPVVASPTTEVQE